MGTKSPPEGFPLMQGGGQGGYPPPQANVYPPLPPGPAQSIPYPPGPNVPLVTQPSAQGGAAPMVMSAPHSAGNCPPGLEYLTMVDQLLVQQKVELLEAFTGFETKNKYLVTNNLGQKVYFAAEDSDCLSRNCCGNLRPFEMKIVDNFGNQVISLNRPLACQGCCFPCCLQTMEVSSPPGSIIGTIEQNWSIFYPSYSVKNASGDIIFRIEGPFCACKCCCQDVNFKVLSADGNTQVGQISKKWSGLAKEAFTDADNFGITFPMDLDVRMKATMLGACFLIDMMYFEENQK